MFADDTNPFFKHKELGVLYTTIYSELATISKWFKLNTLSLHIKKPTTWYFEIKILQQLTQTLSKKTNDIVINKVEKAKFLGVLINSSLIWHDHIHILYNKISKSIGIMLRVKKNVDANVLKMLYHSLVQLFF